MKEKDIFIIEAAHDWVTVFVCSKKKLYSVGLKDHHLYDTDAEYMAELESIEAMSFDELNKQYDSIDEEEFFTHKWKVKK